MEKIKIAVFVSGEGTNCENIIRYFRDSECVEVSVVVSSKAEARAVGRAQRLGVPTAVINRHDLNDNHQFVMHTVGQCDIIVLAGFLLFIPDYLLSLFPRRIVNIHPSLLPKFGGKGMWGRHVHEAVKAAGETQTGITVHYVDGKLDAGEHIAQFSTSVSPDDTPDDIAAKVHKLEQQYFPKVIEEVALERGRRDRANA